MVVRDICLGQSTGGNQRTPGLYLESYLDVTRTSPLVFVCACTMSSHGTGPSANTRYYASRRAAAEQQRRVTMGVGAEAEAHFLRNSKPDDPES